MGSSRNPFVARGVGGSTLNPTPGGVMGYSLVAISMMILYMLALVFREYFTKVYTPHPKP